MIKLVFKKQTKMVPKELEKPDFQTLNDFIKQEFDKLDPMGYRLSYCDDYGQKMEIFGDAELSKVYGSDVKRIRFEIQGNLKDGSSSKLMESMVTTTSDSKISEPPSPSPNQSPIKRDKKVEQVPQPPFRGKPQPKPQQNPEPKKMKLREGIDFMDDLIKKLKEGKEKINTEEAMDKFICIVQALNERNQTIDAREREKDLEMGLMKKKIQQDQQKRRQKEQQQKQQKYKQMQKQQQAQKQKQIQQQQKQKQKQQQQSQPQPHPKPPKNNNHLSITHPGISCHNCHITPITGARYKCSICPQLNWCEECEYKENHEHPFMKIKQCISGDVRVFVLFDRDLGVNVE